MMGRDREDLDLITFNFIKGEHKGEHKDIYAKQSRFLIASWQPKLYLKVRLKIAQFSLIIDCTVLT